MIKCFFLVLAALIPMQSNSKPPSDAPESEPKLFEIGMAEEDMFSRFGMPSTYLTADTKRHVPADSAACMIELCRPVYRRKTARNEYEIVVTEILDESVSRLHPTRRVKKLSFTLDHNMTAENAIRDIEEARLVCANGCKFLSPNPYFFVATADEKRYVVFSHGDTVQRVSTNEPISTVGIEDLKLR